MLSSSLILVITLLGSCYGYTTFETNCTKPSEAVNYVAGADMRGTMDILWSCLFTIVACTWTVLHLNVPEQRERRDPGLMGDIKWGLKGAWRSTKWMIATILAPEVLLGKYYSDLTGARRDLVSIRELAAEDEVPWTLTHCLFANMGGFVLRRHAGLRCGKLRDDRSLGANHLDDPASPELDAGYEAPDVELNLLGRTEATVALKDYQHWQIQNPFHLTGQDIIALRKANIITRLPYIDVSELQDRGKSDALVRVITIIQICWMVIQILVRAGRNLAISQLEIATMAFAFCAVAMYGLNWYKPKGVLVPIDIVQYRDEAPEEVLGTLVSTMRARRVDGLFESFTGSHNPSTKTYGSPIRNDHNSEASDGAVTTEMAGLLIGSLVFGGIHLAAWKCDFPTRIEQILWWSSSIYCTAFVAVLSMLLHTLILLGDKSPLVYKCMEDGMLAALLIYPQALAYVLARLYLLVEVFRTLCFLPPSGYEATWAISFPHIS